MVAAKRGARWRVGVKKRREAIFAIIGRLMEVLYDRYGLE